MAKELQMWADENKTIKGYPKTKAESVYTNEGKKVENELKVIKTNLDNITADLNGYSFSDTPSEEPKVLHLQELENPLPPVITSNDKGKILSVKDDGTGFEYVEKPISGSGSNINDTYISTSTTYSSSKIESRLDEIMLESGNVILRKLEPSEIIEWDFDVPTISVTGVTLNKTTTSIGVGSTETLTATVLPTNATNKNVTWSSSSTSIATVSNGVVTGIGVGNATITATTVDGGKIATCSATITAISVTGVTLDKSTATVSVSGTNTLVATVAPSNATNKNVTWTSSNTAIATVNNGVVTGVAAGTCTITCTTTDGSKTATCSITVQAGTISVTGVSVSPTTATITTLGATQQLTATITPSNATNTGVTWTSSNTSVATVNSTGEVTSVANGTTTITCTAQDITNSAKGICNITVTSTVANQNNIYEESGYLAVPVASVGLTEVVSFSTASYKIYQMSKISLITTSTTTLIDKEVTNTDALKDSSGYTWASWSQMTTTSTNDCIAVRGANYIAVKVMIETLATDTIEDYYTKKYSNYVKFKLRTDVARITVDPNSLSEFTTRSSVYGTYVKVHTTISNNSSINSFNSYNYKFDPGYLYNNNYSCMKLNGGYLEIVFPPNALTNITLDGLKAFLTQYPLTIWTI